MLASAAVIAVGMLATVIQVVLVREALVVFGGNEVVLGLFFGAWFLGIAAGARGGVPLARRLGDRPTVLGAAVLLLGLAAGGSVIGLRVARLVLEVPAGLLPPFASLACYSLLVIAPVGLVVGLAFPLASRLLKSLGRRQAVGVTYWLEGLGAVLGGLGATFLLVPHASALTTLALVSALALTSCSAVARIRHPGAALLGAVAVALVLLALSGGTAALDDSVSQVRWRAQHPGIERERELETPYGHIGMGRIADQYTLFVDGQPVISFPDEYAPPLYAHLAMCQHPSPRNVLLFEGVVNQLLRPALAHPTVEHIRTAELDRRTRNLVWHHQPEADQDALSEERVSLYVGDGRQAVKDAAPGSYDLIAAHLPPPDTARLNRYYTAEFFGEARRALKPDGVLAISLPGAANYLDEAAAGMIGPVLRALIDVFPHVVMTPEGTRHFFASAAGGVVTADVEKLGQRWDERKIGGSTFTRHHFLIHFPPGRTEVVADELRRIAAASEPNTDAYPRSYFFGLVRWNWFSGDEFDSLFAGIAGWPRAVFFLPLLLYLMLRLPWQMLRRHRRNTDALVAVGAAGLAGMSVSLVLFYAYQAANGSLYSEVGLVVGAFMIGLAGGGAAITRRLAANRVARPSRWLGLSTAGLGLYSLALGPGLGVLLGSSVGALPYLLLVLLGGALLGLVFPLAARTLEAGGADVARSAGLVDAADHLGAMLGGLVAGVLLLPLLGIWGACGFTAAACGIAGGMVVLGERLG